MNQPSIFWLFFGLSGRISRAAFLLAGLLMMVVTTFVLYRLSVAQEVGRGLELWESIFGIVVFVSLWCQAALAVKRLHDVGRQGLWAVVMFIPPINFFAFIALCLIPGEEGPNKYGAQTNTPR